VHASDERSKDRPFGDTQPVQQMFKRNGGMLPPPRFLSRSEDGPAHTLTVSVWFDSEIGQWHSRTPGKRVDPSTLILFSGSGLDFAWIVKDWYNREKWRPRRELNPDLPDSFHRAALHCATRALS
jgi:hypothetical protein